MKDLVIIGTGSFAKEIGWAIERINEEEPTWNLLGYVQVDDEQKVSAMGTLEDYFKMDTGISFFVADRDPKRREALMDRCEAAGFTPATIVGIMVRIGPNCQVAPGCYLADKVSLMNEVKLGRGCVVERGSVIGHDTVLGDFCTVRIQGNFGGESNVGKYNYFDMRNTLINMVNTVDDCRFCAGSCIIKHITVPGYYEGVPAKLIAAPQGEN